LKSSGFSAILIEQTFKMMPKEPCSSWLDGDQDADGQQASER
jgi:hypothetical protein